MPCFSKSRRAATGAAALLAVSASCLSAQAGPSADSLTKLVMAGGVQAVINGIRAKHGGFTATASLRTDVIAVSQSLLYLGQVADAKRLLDTALVASRDWQYLQARGETNLWMDRRERALADYVAAHSLICGGDVCYSDGTQKETAGVIARRIGRLQHATRLLAANGVYSDSAGSVVFKFDPYLITGTQLLDLKTGAFVAPVFRDSGSFTYSDSAGEHLLRLQSTDTLVISDARQHTRELQRRPIRVEELSVVRDENTLRGVLLSPAMGRARHTVVMLGGAGFNTRYNIMLEALTIVAGG